MITRKPAGEVMRISSLLLLSLFLPSGLIHAQRIPESAEVSGTPWVGGMGSTETVSEIMTRGQGRPNTDKLLFGEEHELRVMPGRRAHPQHPDAPAISQWPPSKV